MYGDRITKSMKIAIDETNRRRAIQTAYNERFDITPTSIIKAIRGGLETVTKDKNGESGKKQVLTADNITKHIKELENQMKQAAKILNFEKAVVYRDEIKKLKEIKRDLR
jgi:excinuclease ABC subunit B